MLLSCKNAFSTDRNKCELVLIFVFVRDGVRILYFVIDAIGDVGADMAPAAPTVLE